jgi:hypothetical protein
MTVIFLKEYKMKQLLAIIIAAFALTAFATEPSQPTKAADGMMLAKKKDHSKDAKVDATKSPSKSPAKDTKEPAKTDAKSAKPNKGL